MPALFSQGSRLSKNTALADLQYFCGYTALTQLSPAVKLFRAEMLWDHGKNAMQKLWEHGASSLNLAAHFELWCTSLVFMTTEFSCKCLKWKGKKNQIRTAKQTQSEHLPTFHTTNSSGEISSIKGKKKSFKLWDYLGNSHSLCLALGLQQLNGLNCPSRRQKPQTASAYPVCEHRYFCKDHIGFSRHKIPTEVRTRRYKSIVPMVSLEVCPWWK